MDIALILYSVLTVAGQSAENISIIFWIDAMKAAGDSKPLNYAILINTAIAYTAFFWLCVFVYHCFSRQRSPAHKPWQPIWYDRETLKTCIVIGFANALNGFFVVYASDAKRTPAILQALLGNTTVLFALPFHRYYLAEKRNYCQVVPITAIGLLVLATVISLIPTLQDLASGKSSMSFTGSAGALWPFIFLAGQGCAAWYLVLQSKALRHLEDQRNQPNTLTQASSEEAEDAESGGGSSKVPPRPRDRQNTIGERLHVLAWGCTFLLLFFLAGFWIDLVSDTLIS